MSLHSDLKTALSTALSNKLYFLAAPRDTIAPFVIYLVISEEPLMTLQGPEGTVKYTVAFECYGKTGQEALTTKNTLLSTLTADTTLPAKWREPNEEEKYINETDEYMEPVVYSFWHTA